MRSNAIIKQAKESLRYVGAFIPFILIQLIYAFQHPVIHELVYQIIQIVGGLVVIELAIYIYRIWTHGPSQPPVKFRLPVLIELVAICSSVILLIALLMAWNHVAW